MEKLDQIISEHALLSHPFYQRWTQGTLTMEELKTYAINYFPNVKAFPRYVSSVHAQCEDDQTRMALLDNLIEEEHGSENHPELWLRFAEGLGLSREQMRVSETISESKALVETLIGLCQKSYASGLGALYAYESQIPEVAKQKIAGLKEHFDIEDEETLKFFSVHQTADEYHSNSEREAIEALCESEKREAIEAAEEASKALWNFLSALDEHFKPVH